MVYYVKMFSVCICLTLLQARVGGLGVLQTDAEVAASSSVENVAPVSKVEQPTLVAGKSTGGKGEGEAIRPVHLEELMPSREIVDHTVIFEATRGKVDALKQVGSTWRWKCFRFGP